MKFRAAVIFVMVLIVFGKFSLLSASEPPSAISFKLYDGFAIVVRGGIGNQSNLNILVDTGAVPSVIHQRVAQKLNLQGRREVISVVGQNHSMERVMIPNIRLGAAEFPAVSAVVLDLAPIEKRLGLRLDAIVGLDVLGSRDFSIDYRLRQLEIGTPANSGEAVPFELLAAADAPYVVVRMETNSRVVRLLLDTGADGITLFANRERGQALALQKSGVHKDVGAGGEYAAEQVQLLDVRLGGVRRGKRQATMVQTAVSGSQQFDGMLGPTSLGITRLGFNFQRKIVYLRIER
jgi:predicted aspartyl protease